MKIRILSTLLGLLAFLASTSLSLALDVTGRSRTYVLGRETSDDTQLISLYEYLNFKVDGSARDPVSFNFGGWYRHELKNEGYYDRSNEDLQYAYLSIKKGTGNARLDLGRVLVHEGLASEQIDGVRARADLKGGFIVAAYGGSPVETQFDTRRGDSIAGGRISQGIPGYFVLGLSYLDEQNNRNSFRREEGIDIWLRPVSKFEVQGLSSYNEIGGDWMQHNYYVTLGPFGGIRLNGEFTQVEYEQFFTALTVNAFNFPFLDPNEKMTATGGSMDYAITGKLTAMADYKHFQYRIAGPADYFGGKITFLGESFGIGVMGHRMDGSTDRLRYDEMGIFVSRKISPVDLSLQLFHLVYQQEINGVIKADSASAALGFTLSPKARLVADVKYTDDPEFKRDVQAMATFVYSFEAHNGPRVTNSRPAVNKRTSKGM